MNLRQLEAFRATMRSGSITEAANVMHISQPSVSRLIADLERSVGFALFLRSGRGLSPTVEARTFYRAVEGMFTSVDRLQDLADSIRTTSGGVISIGTIQSVAMLELPKVVGGMHHEAPDVRFMIHTRNTPSILDAVQTRQIDIGVVGRQPPYGGVEILFQTSAPYVCLIPESHDLVGQDGSVDLEALTETEAFVTFGGAFPDEMMAMEPDLSNRLRTRSRLSATNMPLAASLVRESGVLAIADPFTAEHAVRMGGVVFRPIRQELNYHVAIIASGRDALSRQAVEFSERLAKRLAARVEYVSSFMIDRKKT